MPINAHPDYLAAEKEYLAAQTLEQKIEKLKKMISLSPSHKGAKNLRAQLTTRLKKLTKQQEKQSKAGKPSKTGIKKADMQAVIIGFSNTGKSTLLKALTNAEPEIASYSFTTKEPVLGTLKHNGVNIQLIEIPAFKSEFYDRGLVNTADTILLLINNLEQIEKIRKDLDKSKGKHLIVYSLSKKDDGRKISETLKSKKYDFVVVDLDTGKNLDMLKDKIFESFDKIRVFTKEPRKEPDKNRPLVLDTESTVEEAAEKILHGFSKKVGEAFVTGPSSKFPNQKVGLKHVLKDLDVLELRTN